MKRYSLILILLIFLGCQTTPFLLQPVTNSPQPEKAIYNPEGKEQFVFNEDDERSFYHDFYVSLTSYSLLPYHKYVGKTGYFEGGPVKNKRGDTFYPVVIETGERLYFRLYDHKTDKYSGLSGIIPIEKYREIKAFKAEPLVPGSSIQLLEVKLDYGRKRYKLSTGNDIAEKELLLLREVYTTYFNNNPQIAQTLLDMDIKKDEVDSILFILPKKETRNIAAELYIVLRNQESVLRFKAQYYGEDWIFVNSYKVAADAFRWKSLEGNFQRDYSSDGVWEWIDIPVNSEILTIAQKLSKAEKATIRFVGDKYYSDKVLSQDQKEYIRKILYLFEYLNPGFTENI